MIPVSEMPAGRELDALVAEKVMGWTLAPPEYVMGWLSHGGSMMRLWSGSGMPNAKGERYSDEGFRPSTEMAFAWQVVEKMRETGWPIVLHITRRGEWRALFEGSTDHPAGNASANTAPLAICRAALKAVGVP